MTKKVLLVIISFISTYSKEGNAQNLSVSDSAIISNKAKMRIERDFIASLNYCVVSINEKEEFDVSVNNLCNASRRIFLNDQVVIENDLDPTLNDSSLTKNEMTVKDYYRYLFDNYSNLKVDSEIFSIKNIAVSGLKKRDSLTYIKVYFDLENRGIHSDKIMVQAKQSRRIAELHYSKPESAKEAFEVYIMSIRFYDPLISITDSANNISSFTARDEYDKRRNEGELFHQGNAELNKEAIIAKNITSAKNAFNENEFARALQLCSEVLTMDPENLEALNLKKQIESTQTKIKEDTGQLELLKRLFNHQDTLRQYDAANKTYKEIKKLNPDFSNEEISKEMDRIQKVLAFTSEMRLLYNSKTFDEIIDKCERNLTSNQEEPETYYWRGKAFSAKRKYGDAVNDYNKALLLAPKYNDVLEELANYYTENGYKNKTNYSEAVKYYTLLIFNNPQQTNYYINRAAIKNRMGQKKEAITQDYDEALKSDDGNSEILFLKGQTLYETGDNAGAINVLSKAIASMPDSGKYYFYRAMIFSKIDSFPQAGEDFRLALEKEMSLLVRQQFLNTTNTELKHNKAAPYYFNRGMAFILLSDYKKAKADLTRANKKGKHEDVNYFLSRCNEKLKSK